MDINNLRKRIVSGNKIVLIEMKGESDMNQGLKGVVEYIDDIGNVHVTWENGRTLSICPEVDKYIIEN